jgi:hypothetical protein
VHKGLDILESLNEAAVDPNDVPLQRTTITSCGLTDSQGTHESLDDAVQRKARQQETPEQAAGRLQAESRQVRESVRYALAL